MPPTPTLSVENDETGSSVTATVAGSGTITLLYRKASDTAWTAGASRTGDGEISQTGLEGPAVYEFSAVADDGGYSLPADPEFLRVYDPDQALQLDTGALLMLRNLRDLVAATNTWQEWTGEGSQELAERHIRYFGVNHPTFWHADTAVEYGTILDIQRDDYVVECTSGGTTGSDEPDWSTISDAGDTISDGTATWTARDQVGSDPDNTAIRLARPFAMIGIRGGITDTPQFQVSSDLEGDFDLSIQADVPDAHRLTLDDAGVYMLRMTMRLIEDMRDLGNAGGYLRPTRLKLNDFARANDDVVNDMGDFFQVWIRVTAEDYG